MKPTRVLVAEDSAIVAMDVELRLGKLGYDVVGVAMTADEAVRMATELKPGLALLDISLAEGSDGIDAGRRILERIDIPIIYLTAHSDETTVARARTTGPQGYLLKPFDERELGIAIELALYKHRVERELAEARHAAEQARQELEAFSYAVAHDLRSPLRIISSYSEILLEEEAERLSEDGVESLTRIRKVVERTMSLTTELMVLARSGKSELRVGDVDMSLVARDILTGLARSEPERVVEVHVADDMQVAADEGMLRTALENLLNNAWKFTSKLPAARIDVGSELVDDEPTFFVRDNGAGFDADRADEVFAPFKRLHADVEFPGHGLGLATVRRIVERHGGEIWAAATKGEGACFYFRLPVAT